MHRRWTFFLLKLAIWRRITRHLLACERVAFRAEFNVDLIHNGEGRWPQYPGAVSMVLVTDGRNPGA
jgi:hypothetical protein